MDYENLKAAELKALCEARDIKPHKAKAVMIADLKARDAADELSALQAPLEPVQEPEDSVPAPSLEKPAQRPVEALTYFPWVEDGLYLLAVPRNGVLEQDEHERNLREVADKATSDGFNPYGPPFRSHEKTQASFWVYGINIRQGN